ncbi:Dehydrogenase/reductase SDR family member 13-like protein 1 [Colletotrichum chlorophyti]|uniref:Dehydrogenase/reductase SDR family member 13-like protein 1 n=1 Tax=Colletotrichum chlorophyti TaxID=708187 RepID=A0A1Q8S570_9PEZI|nr:Dehydrogenase/reductase SDR family member 13-like protein 1 [Colletotrichum chlorophyti]
MVTLYQVRQSNARLTEATIPRTALFVGGTSGIGRLALIELASLGFPIKVYVVGRKATESAMRPLLDDLQERNPKAELVWVEGEVSLLAEVRRICDFIKSKESNLDFVCLTAGYVPFGGRNNTVEGLEVTHALEYYGRMLFTLVLLPLLRLSPSGRVLTVLGGSMLSNDLFLDDLNLEKPGNFGGVRTQTHMNIMNTLFLDRLAHEPGNESISFVHNWPGAVNTGNLARYHTRSWRSPVSWTVLVTPLLWLVGFGEKEAGERHLYVATSGRFGGKGPMVDGKGAESGARRKGGGGLFLVNNKCDVSYKEDVLRELRAEARGKVWDKTMEILGPYL